MKISAAPSFSMRTLDQAPPTPPTPPAESGSGKPDQVDLGSPDPGPGPEKGIRWGAVAVTGAAVAAGATIGAIAGNYGGIAAEVVALGCVPGLATAGALLGGVGFEALGPSSSEYRAIGGMMIGGLVGAGAGLAQAFLVSGGGTVAATTLGISGGVMGLAMLFKAALDSKSSQN